MARIEWTSPGTEQFQEVIEYLNQHSPRRAHQLGSRIVAAAKRLSTSPLMGRVVPEYDQEHIREVIVAPYRLLYIVRDDVVLIAGVVDSRRDLRRHFHPEDFDE